ncbi:MAG: hypothetical protein P4L84_26305 [Isosphaeraceae bacterium]|nr:hypothetical protein [Isosphaeraceae bacterium]
MSVAALRPSAVVYREEQNFDWRVYAFVAFWELLAWGGLAWYVRRAAPGHAALGEFHGLPVSWFAILLLGAVTVFLFALLRMTTEVSPTDIHVWFGWLPIYRKRLATVSIQRIEVVNYRPIFDHGGWGIRIGRDGERVLSAKGNRGVRLELTDGSRLLIGSQQPEALARALERAVRPGA